MKWSYGVTTCPQRRGPILNRTLLSLSLGGFDSPRLFVDGDRPYATGGRPASFRDPPVGAYRNWYLGLAELMLREPLADWYALFQDDLVVYRNLRQYLERSPATIDSYRNLYTAGDNEAAVRSNRLGWHAGVCCPGTNQQRGVGALALVFDRMTALRLLTALPLWTRPAEVDGSIKIDGATVALLNRFGIHEYVHNPSLVSHTGVKSTIGHPPLPNAKTWRGQEYDALEMLRAG